MDSFNFFKGENDKDFNISAMKKYVNEKQEMDKKLESLVAPIIRLGNFKILDACCGIGHLSYFLSDINLSNTFLGVDQTPYLIEEAQKLCSAKSNVSFEVNDMHHLSDRYQKFFDVSIIWKTISWLPYYEEIIQELFKVSKKHIFLSSLFYDGDIDFEIKVREYKKQSGKENFNSYYNVYSFPKFERFVQSLNCKKIHSWNFDISLDIPRGDPDFMGTYTLKLYDGERIQISGAIIMSWKIVHIEL